jgi:hypothetical protein
MPYRSLFVLTDFLVCNYVLRFNVIGGPEKIIPRVAYGPRVGPHWLTSSTFMAMMVEAVGQFISDYTAQHPRSRLLSFTFFFVLLCVVVFLTNVFKLIN